MNDGARGVTGLRLRRMRADDIPAGLALCRAARWNQTAREWELFLHVAGERAVVAEHEGIVVGTVVTVPHDAATGWVAMVLVDPAHRGRGIGRALLAHALESAPAGTTLRLDATPAGRALYLTLGFEDELGLARWRRLRPTSVTMDRAVADVAVRPLDDGDWPAIFALDRLASGADRREVLEWACRGAPEYACVAAGKAGGSGQPGVTGFVLGRHGHDAEHIGPVVAHSTDVAAALVSACLAGTGAHPVFIDVPDRQEALRGWLFARGFAVERPFTRMRRGAATAQGAADLVFAIVGPELG